MAEEKEKKQEGFDQNDLRFATFVASLATGAFQHLGKIANPFTGKIERDLQAAKATIDMLVMLKEKTKGNLSPDEQKLIDGYITNLQLNYLEESKKEPQKAEEKKEEKKEEKQEKTEAAPEKREQDSNRRPTVYETVALPLSYAGPMSRFHRRMNNARNEKE